RCPAPVRGWRCNLVGDASGRERPVRRPVLLRHRGHRRPDQSRRPVHGRRGRRDHPQEIDRCGRLVRPHGHGIARGHARHHPGAFQPLDRLLRQRRRGVAGGRRPPPPDQPPKTRRPPPPNPEDPPPTPRPPPPPPPPPTPRRPP